MTTANLRRPSAYVPLVMSTLALVVVVLHVAIVGAAPQRDEGAAAHVFQLLVAAQVPVILYQALRWTPVRSAGAMQVFGLQALAALIACTPVALLGL